MSSWKTLATSNDESCTNTSSSKYNLFSKLRILLLGKQRKSKDALLHTPSEHNDIVDDEHAKAHDMPKELPILQVVPKLQASKKQNAQLCSLLMREEQDTLP